MQEHRVLEVPASPVNGTNDLLSRLYREIGISAVAAALEINHRHQERELIQSLMVPGAEACGEMIVAELRHDRT